MTGAAVHRVAISGAGGLVGSALSSALKAAGYQVSRLVRRPALKRTEICWDPRSSSFETDKLQGVDALIHLAGENLATTRWTARKKQLIHDSRVMGTRLIAEKLAKLTGGPRVLLNASAIGYYGDRGDEILDESSPAGTGFLAETCRAWEAATEPAARAGIRVARLRIGIVLSSEGGALARMLPAFKLGLGGPLGSGRQYMSWIALADLVAACRFILENGQLEGALNLVAPAPVRNAEFARALGRTLHRPALLPLPAVLIKLIFGEMGRELLLAGARVLPASLERAGFQFRHAELAPALAHLLR